MQSLIPISWNLERSTLNFGLLLLAMFFPLLILALKSSVSKARNISQSGIFLVMYGALILPPILVSVFFLLLSVLMLKEIFDCLKLQANAYQDLKALRWGSFLLLPLVPVLYVLEVKHSVHLVFGYFLLLTTVCVTRKTIAHGVIGVIYALLALLSIASVNLFSYISSLEHGANLALFIFFLTNICDMFALLGGKMWGKRKLIEISPNKTVEGAVSSIAAGIGFSIVFDLILELDFAVWQAVLIGLLTGIFAQIGDLFGSLFKRQLGIKDYGNLIPGHGGVLDRMDSLVVTLPLFVLLHALFTLTS
jgi:phosphatidate cytidylyltransferase